MRGEAVDALLAPRSIAVVGASRRPGPGQRVVSNLLATGFRGSLYPVNPRHATISGLITYPRLADLPEVPDLVVVAVNREVAVDVLAEAAKLGCRAAMILGAGFGEADERGRELEGRLKQVTSSMAVMGPNCLGHMNLIERVAAYSGPLAEPFQAGNVALVSNSGALACTLTGAGAERGIRFSHVVTTGNQLGLTTADYVRYLSRQPAVQVIACYLEGFREGRALVDAFREAGGRGKALVLLKAGRSVAGSEAARTHTGTFAGSHVIQRSLWEQERVLLADDLEDLLALVEICSRCAAPAGPRLGVVTISGGERLLLADEAERVRLPLASLLDQTRAELQALLPDYATVANPLDTTGAGLVERDSATHATAARLLAGDPTVDLVLISQDAKNGWVQSAQASTLFYDGVVASCEAVKGCGKPVVILTPTPGQIDERVRQYVKEEGIPLLHGLRPGMSALAQFVRRHVSAEAESSIERIERGQVYMPRTEGGRALAGYDAFQLLKDTGIATWPTRLVAGEEEAVQAAQQVGFPVALKLDGEGLLHRTDVGGIRLHLADKRAVRQAWHELEKVGRSLGSSFRGVLVQPMVTGGVELFVGAWRDEQFGPVVLFGPGGTLVELGDALAVGLAPLDRNHAARLVSHGKVRRLLQGWRGAPPANRGALLHALEALSRVASRPEVVALDVNPLVALPDSVALIDAKIVVRDTAPQEVSR